MTKAISDVRTVAPRLLRVYCSAFCRPSGVGVLVVNGFSPRRVVSAVGRGRTNGAFLPTGPVRHALPPTSIRSVVTCGRVRVSIRHPGIVLKIGNLSTSIANGRTRGCGVCNSLLLRLLFNQDSSRFVRLCSDNLVSSDFNCSFGLSHSFRFVTIRSSARRPGLLRRGLGQVLLR